MKILHISLLTPIPDVFAENDYLFKTVDAHLEVFPDDEVFIVRPVPYSNAFLSKLFPFNSAYRAIKNKESYKWKNYDVMLMPYISAKRINNIHSILCSSLYYLNKRRIKKFLDEHKIDVVHAQLLYPDAVLAYFLWKNFNIPYFITSHWELDYLENNISRFFTKKLLKNAKYIFPIAQVNQNTYLEIGINHTKVVPLGFDDTFYNATKILLIQNRLKLSPYHD
ncbi:MAG: glycosyltransferase [Bacteroidales bacterium]|nr:glycosyltransferase [Bacteroidales bacterium]